MKKTAVKFIYVFVASIIFFISTAFCHEFPYNLTADDAGSTIVSLRLDNESNEYDFIIIGAGFSGAYMALELAKDGYRILVLEKDSQTIGSSSTSFNQCYKLHSGLHYFGDPETAIKCLRDSIAYAKKWSSYLLGDPGTPQRRNRHYVMSNSLYGIEDARNVADILKKTYADLVKQNPTNQVFGDPGEFIKEVGPEEYSYVAEEIKLPYLNEKQKVVLAFDVGEPQIDIKRIRKHLHDSITSTPNIKSLFGHEVKKIELHKDKSGFSVVVYNDEHNKVRVFKAKGVINCAWHNIERLDKAAGIYNTKPIALFVRDKISILVKLPNEIIDIATLIFSLGKFCSITNQYDGTAILTYEPVTNSGFSKGSLTISEERGQGVASSIIDNCAIFVPKIGKAQALETRIGFVKTYARNDEVYSIDSKESPIHKRREGGIEVHSTDPVFISVSGMKMTYTQKNAQIVRDILCNASSYDVVRDIVNEYQNQ